MKQYSLVEVYQIDGVPMHYLSTSAFQQNGLVLINYYFSTVHLHMILTGEDRRWKGMNLSRVYS